MIRVFNSVENITSEVLEHSPYNPYFFPYCVHTFVPLNEAVRDIELRLQHALCVWFHWLQNSVI
jgi:hypothetical protein